MEETTSVALKAVALFAGCGGLSLGFRNAGFEITAAFENWDTAIEVFRKNFPDTEVHNFDLARADGCCNIFQRFCPDIIIGGPPCQDYSHAGKRNEELGRADLTVTFASIVVGVKPQWFVMENVDRILKSKRLKRAKELFKEAGYGLTGKLLNACRCGAPQYRKRFFLIGKLGSPDDFLSQYLDVGLAEKPMTVRDYLGNRLGIEYYYRHPRNYSRRAIFSIDEPSPTIRGVNRPVPKTYKLHPRDAVSTLEGVRPLTTIERSYIQTFPDTYIFEGSKTDLEQMIGNAVPVRLAEYVATCIRAFVRDGEKTEGTREPKKHQLVLL